MDGVVVIGTELDETPLDKKLRKLETQLENQELDLEIKVSNIDNVKQELKEVGKELRKLKAESNELNKSISSKQKQYDRINNAINAGEHLTPEEYMRYGSLENQLSKLYSQQSKINKEMDKYNNKYNNLSDKLYKVEKQYDKQINKIKETKSQIIAVQNEQNKTSLNIDGVGKSIEKVTKKVGRWALAIFGIRSAYLFIRKSISILSQYNEKLASDIQNIQYALASALEPIILRIVELVYKLLGYLGFIIKAWTGKNIFANASKGLKSANKEAKELKKQLAGFDEMNVLQDNKQSSSSGGTLSGDLSKLPDKVPGWVEWIAGNGRELLAIIAGIVAGVTALKLGLKGIKALGLGIVIAGIVKLIGDVIDYLKDPSWEKFSDILIDIGIILVGLALLFTSWPLALAGAIVLMLGIIAKFWDDIKQFLTNLKQNIFDLGDKIKDWLYEKLGDWGRIIGVFVDTIVGVVTSLIDGVLDLFGGLFEGLRGILDGIISIFKEGIGKGLVKIFKSALNIIISLVNVLIDGLNGILSPIRALVVVIGKIMGKDWTMDNIKIPKIPKLARGGIVHNPGSGVLMGSYVAGEGASPEAVLPLNDETLDKLGEKIAKHMTINANITNTMNGRVISRELHKINNESSFAYNG